MTSCDIKAHIATYFRYKRQASLVMFERGLDTFGYGNGIPDVLIVTDDLKLIEVEVKVSYADFKNDAKKYKWEWRERHNRKHQFYYAAPEELAKRIKMEVLPEFGVLSVHDYGDIVVLKKAAQCKDRISHKQFWKLIRHQTGTMISLANQNISLYRRVKEYENEKDKQKQNKN